MTTRAEALSEIIVGHGDPIDDSAPSPWHIFS